MYITQMCAYHVTDNQYNMYFKDTDTPPERPISLLGQGGCHVVLPDPRKAMTSEYPPNGNYTWPEYLYANKQTFIDLFPKLSYTKHKGYAGVSPNKCDKESLVDMFLPATGLIGVPILLRVVLGDVPGSAALTIAGAVAGYTEGKALTTSDPTERKKYANIAGDIVSVMGPFGLVQIGASTMGISDAQVVPLGVVAGIGTYFYFGPLIKDTLDVASGAGGFLLGILSWFQSLMEDTLCVILDAAKNVSSNQCTKYVQNKVPQYAPWTIAETAYAMVTSRDEQPGAAAASFASQIGLLSYQSNAMEYGQLGGGGCVWQPYYLPSSGAVEQCGDYNEIVSFFDAKPQPIHMPETTLTPTPWCQTHVADAKTTAARNARSYGSVPGNSLMSQLASYFVSHPTTKAACSPTENAFIDANSNPPPGATIVLNSTLETTPTANQLQETYIANEAGAWPATQYMSMQSREIMGQVETLKDTWTTAGYDCTTAWGAASHTQDGQKFLAALNNNKQLYECSPAISDALSGINMSCTGHKCTMSNFNAL